MFITITAAYGQHHGVVVPHTGIQRNCRDGPSVPQLTQPWHELVIPAIFGSSGVLPTVSGNDDAPENILYRCNRREDAIAADLQLVEMSVVYFQVLYTRTQPWSVDINVSSSLGRLCVVAVTISIEGTSKFDSVSSNNVSLACDRISRNRNFEVGIDPHGSLRPFLSTVPFE